MEAIKKMFIEYCEKEGILFEELDENSVQVVYHGKHANYITHVMVMVQSQALLIHTHFPINIPKEKQEELLQLINKINMRIIMGSFVYDPENDMLMFRTSVYEEGSVLNDRLFDIVLFGNLMVIDKYFPEIARLILNNSKESWNKTDKSSGPDQTEDNSPHSRNWFSDSDRDILNN